MFSDMKVCGIPMPTAVAMAEDVADASALT